MVVGVLYIGIVCILFFTFFYACNWASTYYFHVYCPAFSNICQHKVITKKLEGGGQGKARRGVRIFSSILRGGTPHGTYERKVVCCTKPSIDLVIFEKAYYPVTDSCHGFGNLYS